MRKIKRSSELLWLLGIIFVALGVAVCSKADLGVSMIAAPSFIVHEAIEHLLPWITVGVTEYIIQGILLIILCIIVRRFNWRYLIAFAVAMLYGYTLDFFLWMLSPLSFDAVWLRWVMLLVGDVIVGFGVACFFRTYMPLQVFELFVAELSSRFKLKIDKVKAVFDVSLLVISVTLALTLFGDIAEFDWSTILYSSFHSIGLGTFVTTAINSAIILTFGRIIDKTFEPTPLFPKLENILRRK